MQIVPSKVVVVRTANAPDKIYIHLDKKTAEKIHGPHVPLWYGASFTLETAQGRAEGAIRALDISMSIVEIVQID